MISKIKKVCKNPRKILIKLASKGILNYDDKKYLEFVYEERMHKKLNLENPTTYTEKLQWLKLYNRKDEYTKLVDKYEVRAYVKEKIGEEYLVPLIGIYNSIDEIDFDKLPNQFVIKTTHDSGTAILCKDKNKFDKNIAKKAIKKSLKRKYYYLYREWPYKNVKPRIIIEKYMENKDCKELNDYKFYCFNGEPKIMFIVKDRKTNEKINFYDMDFKKLDVKQICDNFEDNNIKPRKFKEMKELSRKLSKGIPHVRVDFYEINEKIYFGELTFFDSAGLEPYEPDDFDKELGKYIDIRNIK